MLFAPKLHFRRKLSYPLSFPQLGCTTRKVSQKIGALSRAGHQLTLPAKRIFYVSAIAVDLEYGSNAFSSSLSSAFKEKLIRLSNRGSRTIFRAVDAIIILCISNWKFSPFSTAGLTNFLFSPTDAGILSQVNLHSDEFSVVLGRSNARAQSVRRGQSFISFSLLNVWQGSGTISPVFTCSLLWNSLPSFMGQGHPDVAYIAPLLPTWWDSLPFSLLGFQ